MHLLHGDLVSRNHFRLCGCQDERLCFSPRGSYIWKMKQKHQQVIIVQFDEFCMTGVLRTWQAECLLGQVSFTEVCAGIPREMMHGE